MDHRKRPRRRGDALDDAILRATLDELAEVGYARLTMERVAERAKAGKASVYRRWGSRMELAVAAVYRALPSLTPPRDTGSLRTDLLALLRDFADAIAGPAGEALRGLLSDTLRDPARTAELRRHTHGTSRRAMEEIVRRAAERGELADAAVGPRRLEVGQAMLRHHFLFHGVPIPDDVIVGIVDDVLLPVLTAPRPSRPSVDAAAPGGTHRPGTTGPDQQPDTAEGR